MLEVPLARRAVKTAGSLVPSKPGLQCGSGPRAQYSDDFRSPMDCGGSRLGDYLFCTVRARRTWA